MSRFLLAIESGAALLLTAAGTCCAFLMRAGPVPIPVLGIALIVPAIAAVLYLCVSLAVPELYAVGKLRFPLNLTLPAVYTGLLILTLTLMSRVGPTIARPSDRFEVMNIWARPVLLGVSFGAAVIALSVLSRSPRKHESSVDSA